MARRAVKKIAPVTDRRLIPIDETPLRKRAATEFKRAMTRLDKAHAEWQRFEQEDRPSFERWIAATFGALSTKLRENARLISEQESLIQAVQMEMILGSSRDPRKAYAAVMKQRENPYFAEDFAEGNAGARPKSKNASNGTDSDHDDGWNEHAEFDPFRQRGGDIPKEHRRAVFDDFVRAVLGFNPEQLGKQEYARMFAQFEKELFGDGESGNPFKPPKQERRVVQSEDARIKEIYRMLVRRLHPDLRADGDAKVSAIWHDVQEAYETRNLDRMETLLALTEMHGDGTGAKASLSQMRGVLKELSRGLQTILRSIGRAKRDPAWRFSQNENHAALEKRVRFEMEDNLSQQEWTLLDQKEILDDWLRPRRSVGKKAPKKPKPSVKPKTRTF